MKKIAVLYSGGRQWGGIETYLANLFRLYDRDQMQLLLVSLGEWELTRAVKDDGQACEVRELSAKRLRLRTVLELRRLLKDEGFGLIASQGTVANAYARLAALMARVPSLVVVHSDMKLDYPPGLIRWLYLLSDRTLRPLTQSYVAVSRYLRDRLVASGVDTGRVRVVYNGVQNASTMAGTTAGSGVCLASVGRLHAVKNFDSLIRALTLLPDKVRLTIWGDGGERGNLEALVCQLGLSARVRLPGESESMTEALEGTAIYVQPSKSEGCSFAVAEAMLHGRPVVVSPCGGLPEQVEHGVTGLVAADCSPEGLAQAIEIMVRDPESAGRMGAAGRRAAEEMYAVGKWLRSTTAALCESAIGAETGQD